MSRHLDGSPKPVAPVWYHAHHYLRIRCYCGRTASLKLGETVRKHHISRDTPIYRVIPRLKCTGCGLRPREVDVGHRPGLPFTDWR